MNREKILSKQFYTKQELADLIKVTTRTITNLMKRGKLAYHKIGRSVRFSSEDIVLYLERTHYEFSD